MKFEDDKPLTMTGTSAPENIKDHTDEEEGEEEESKKDIYVRKILGFRDIRKKPMSKRFKYRTTKLFNEDFFEEIY